jgi:3-oxoacyl-[acyl-carrier-protein] synthase-3
LNFTFQQKRISGLLAILPAGERFFVDDMKNFDFPEARSLKLKEVMGYDKHRLVEPDVCVSDLAVFGLNHLFEKGLLEKDSFDALILVTQSPDHFMPATSNIIQGRLGLKRELFCMDINQGCAGYLVGLIQAFMLLEQPNFQRVVLINADVLSRKVSPKDRNSYPLVGDGASITVVERSSEDCCIHANVKMDGQGSDVLIIPAGGFRMPSTPETAVLEDSGENNLRAKDHLRMNGSAVFNFVQTEIPPLIEELMTTAGVTDEEIAYYICHQPNRFMLQKLADKLKVQHSKVPMNVVEHFGNSSGVTIPIAIAFNLADELLRHVRKVCLAGFGVGLTWGAMLLDLGNLDFCALVDFPILQTNQPKPN